MRTRGEMDTASDFGSEDCGFESHRVRFIFDMNQTQLFLHGVISDNVLDRTLEKLDALFPKNHVKCKSYMDRIVQESQFFTFEYVWIPCIETNPGAARKDDLMLRLWTESDTLGDLNLKEWNLTIFGRPEKGQKCNRRQIKTSFLKTNFTNSVLFLRALGYMPIYQFLKKGYCFKNNLCFQLCKLFKVLKI